MVKKELTPLEQSKEIIRKHCEKQTKPCFLMRDLENPFSEIKTALTKYDKMVSSIKRHIKNLKAQRDELDKERDPILRDDVTIFILNSKIKLLEDLLKGGVKK